MPLNFITYSTPSLSLVEIPYGHIYSVTYLLMHYSVVHIIHHHALK